MIKNFLLSIFLLLIPSCFWGNTAYRPQVSVAGLSHCPAAEEIFIILIPDGVIIKEIWKERKR